MMGASVDSNASDVNARTDELLPNEFTLERATCHFEVAFL